MSRTQAFTFAALIALSLLGHADSLANGFVYDDHRFVAENSALNELSWHDALLVAATHTSDNDRDVYRPLRTLSHAFDRECWGLDPFGFHLHSVLLHVACVLLALVTLKRLLPARYVAAAVFGAAILAVHPVGVEAVGWISSRGDQLALGFTLLTLLAATLPSRGLALGLTSLMACAATLGKESAAVVPAVIALHMWVNRRSNASAPTLQRGSSLAATLGVLGALVLRQVALDGASPIQTLPHGGDAFTQVGWALFGIGKSAAHFVWPTELSVRYPAVEWASAGAPWGQRPALVGALLLTCIALGCWKLKRAKRVMPSLAWALFLVGWAGLVYLPSSSLIVTLRELVNDRALLPCLAALGAALAVPCCHFRVRWPTRALAGLLLAALLPLTWQRVSDFRSDSSLWQATLRVVPRSAGARLGLARQALRAGQIPQALELMRSGVDIAPPGSKQHAELLAHYADALLRHSDDRQASLAVLSEALAAVRHWDALENPSVIGDATAASFAEALVALGRPEQAFELLDHERQRAARPEQLDLKRAILLRELIAAQANSPWLTAFDQNFERVTRVLSDHPLVKGLTRWRATLD